jgi:hypothetical protein
MSNGISLDSLSIIIVLMFNGFLLIGLVSYFLKHKVWSNAEPDDLFNVQKDPVAFGEVR